MVFSMKDNIKEWLKVITSILFFNLIILGTLYFSKLISPYTITIKVVLDVAIGFVTDKSIKKLKVGWKDGFSIERNSNNSN